MRELRYQVMAESAPVVAHSSTQACEDTARWVPGAQAALGVLNFRATLEADVLVGDMDETRRRYNLPPRFAVVSNQWYRHKNHPVVVEALRLLKARGITVPCVVTGRAEDHRWPDYGPSLQRRIAELGLTNTIYLVGLVPRVVKEELAEPVEGHALHEAGRDDPVGVDVRAGNRYAAAGHGGDFFERHGWNPGEPSPIAPGDRFLKRKGRDKKAGFCIDAPCLDR